VQLATFMSDLESSGLLGADGEDAQQPAAEPWGAAPAAGAASAAGGAAQGAAEPAAAARPASGAAAGRGASAGASAVVEAAEEQGGAAGCSGGTDGGAPDGGAADGGGGAEQAEQRVLGPLEGLPEWVEVMDMGSRRVYFWHPPSNAVEWDPPAGGTPRDVGDVPDASGPEADVVMEQPGRAAGAAAGQPGGAAKAAEARPQPAPADAAAAGSREADGAAAAAPAAEYGPASAAAPAAAGVVSARPAGIALPSDDLARQTARLVERLRTSAGGFFAAAPKLVWLAIEAEIRAQVQSSSLHLINMYNAVRACCSTC